MQRLTVNDGMGNWYLKGVEWQHFRAAKPVPEEVQRKIYAALFKLMEYENSGLDPDEVQKLANKGK